MNAAMEAGRLKRLEHVVETGESALWDSATPPGGYVCLVCGVPVESEPCARHDWAWKVKQALADIDDLRSRLACIQEACSWDRPYETRIAAIRGMCDLTQNGFAPIESPAVPRCPVCMMLSGAPHGPGCTAATGHVSS